MTLRLLSLCAIAAAGCSTVRQQQASEFTIRSPVPSDPDGFSAALLQSVGVALEPGHRLELVDNGTVFEAMEKDIRAARRSVHLVSYIWKDGPPGDALIAALVERARAGVRCRVLVDAFGSLTFSEGKARLLQGGCEVKVFRPMPGEEDVARNHRKLLVTDGRVGITGGFGIMKEWMGQGRGKDEWRDSNVRIQGPAVLEMQLAFAENWQEAGGALLPADELVEPPPAGPAKAAFVRSSSTVVTAAERLTHLAIHSARSRLWIANSYFVPNQRLIELLVAKRRQGVDVRVLVPGDENDVAPVTAAQRATYDALLPNGIRIFEYQPGMMHAKTMLIDEARVVIGSINLDPLSLGSLEEGAVVAEDRALAAALEETWEQDMRYVKEITRP